MIDGMSASACGASTSAPFGPERTPIATAPARPRRDQVMRAVADNGDFVGCDAHSRDKRKDRRGVRFLAETRVIAGDEFHQPGDAEPLHLRPGIGVRIVGHDAEAVITLP